MDGEHRSAHTHSHIQDSNASRISDAQFRAIAEAAKVDNVFFEREPIDGPPTYIWQQGHILVAPDVDPRQIIFEGAGLAAAPVLEQDGGNQGSSLLPTLLELPPAPPGGLQRSTKDIVESLNKQRGLEGKVFVNNLVYVTHADGANLCPADEPTPVRPFPETTPYPPPARGNGGKGVRVLVIDTGLSDGWEIGHPWLFDLDRDPPTEVSGDPEISTYGNTKEIQQYVGHGGFIAGVIRCVAPRASVRVANTLRWAGSMHEHEVARVIIDALDGVDGHPVPDIISLSAGVMVHMAQGPQAMLGVLERLRKPDCHTLLVAAAGNDGVGPHDAVDPLDRRLFYPAAFAEEDPFLHENVVVAVGALRVDRAGRACFSNYGPWVTVYEDGEKIINAFPTGKYTYHEPLSSVVPPHCIYSHTDPPLEEGCTCVTAPVQGTVAHFRGMAAWSGTSFSTPIVVGRIARHMTKESKFAGKPRAAFTDLLDEVEEIEDEGDPQVLRRFTKPVYK